MEVGPCRMENLVRGVEGGEEDLGIPTMKNNGHRQEKVAVLEEPEEA